MSDRKYSLAELDSLSKKELIEIAKKEQIPGRSRMSKGLLVKEIIKKNQEEEKNSGIPSVHGGPSSFSPSSFFQPERTAERIPEESLRELPREYGENCLVLMVRDPRWIFSYWEIVPGHFEGVRESLGEEKEGSRTVMRVSDVTGIEHEGEEPNSFFDIPVYLDARNWYFEVNDDRSYRAELGFLTRSSRFYPLVRSNRVDTPREGVSPVVDEKWMAGPEFEELFAISAGARLLGEASLEFQQELRERIKAGLIPPFGASELISSFASGAFRQKERGFYFWLDAEIIFYGGTDPKAKVFLKDKAVPLRSDGTFTVRFSLPNGFKEYPFEAISPDEVETRRITPVVERKTEVAEPVVR